MSLTIRLVSDVKWYIQHDKVDELQQLVTDIYTDLQKGQCYVDWQYLFKEAYLYSCNKKKEVYIDLCKQMYEKFDPKTQLYLKPFMTYGKYLAMPK